MVLYSWLCPLCLPKALSSEGLSPRILWATTSLLVLESHSLALEVGEGHSSDTPSAEPESQRGWG